MDFGDFFGQIPPGIFLMTCGSGILLVVAWSYILYRRGQRRIQRNLQESGVQLEAQPPKEPQPTPLMQIGREVRNFFFYPKEQTPEAENLPEATPQAEVPPTPPGPAPTPANADTFNEASVLADATTSAAMTGSVPQGGMMTVSPSSSAPNDAVEVLRVWRDVIDGSLIIQIGNQYYRSMPEVRAAGQERRFMAVLRELARIAKEVSPAAGAPAQPAAAPQAVSPKQPAPSPVTAPQPDPPAHPAPQPTFQAAQPTPVMQPGMAANTTGSEQQEIGSFFDNVRKAVSSRGKAETTDTPATTLSIPEQIELYLQQKLAVTPQFQGRNIHVGTAAGGGVLIQVDDNYYEGVGDIAEKEVREFVMNTIQEWESHH